MTAYEMLVKRAKIKNSEKVLIYGASSGVGSAAIQIAKEVGCTVYSTVGNEAKKDFAFKLSAAEAELKYFEVQYSGSDRSDVGVLVTADEVKVYDVLSRYNKYAFKVSSADEVELRYLSMHCDGSSSSVDFHYIWLM